MPPSTRPEPAADDGAVTLSLTTPMRPIAPSALRWAAAAVTTLFVFLGSPAAQEEPATAAPEKSAASASAASVAQFSSPKLALLAASIAGVEAMHWSALLGALGENPVPVSFIPMPGD